MITKIAYKHLFKQFFTYFFLSIVFLFASQLVLGQDTLQIKQKQKKNSEKIESPIQYESQDSIVFEVESRIVKTFGNGAVQYQNIDLRSQYIEFDVIKNEVFAKGLLDTATNKIAGAPVYKDASDSYDSDSMKYNFKTKQGLVFGIFSEQSNGYLQGKRTKIHANKEIHIKSGKFTTCDEKCPHFYVEISRGKVIPDEKIIFGPAWIVIDEIVLPIVLPFGYFPISNKRANGILLPTVGEDQTKGFYFRDFGYYMGIGDFFDLRLAGDIYTNLSWRSNVRSNYIVKYKYNGSFEVGYSSLRNSDFLDEPQTMFNVKWFHQQDPKSMTNASFSANVNYGSAGFATYNAYEKEEFLNSSVTSNISYEKRISGTPFRYSISLDHSQNNLDSVVSLTLPRLYLSMGSLTPFKKNGGGTPRFYNNISFSYNADAQNKLVSAKMDSTFYTSKTWDAFQNGIKHSIPINTSFNLFKYVTVSPSFNYTERWYGKRTEKTWNDTVMVATGKDTVQGGVVTNNKNGFYRVYNYSFNADANTKIYGMYLLQNKYVPAIRHVISPSIGYRWAPDFTQADFDYYGQHITNSKGDVKTYSYYSTNIYGVPNTTKQSAINFSISNNIEAKIKDDKDTITGYTKVKLLENLTISSAYNFAAEEFKLDLIRLSAYTTIMKRLSVRYSATFDPYVLIKKDNEIVRADSYMLDKYGTLWRKQEDDWNFGVSYSFKPISNNETPRSKSIYSYYSVPWNLQLNYSLHMNRENHFNYSNVVDSVTSTVIQTVGVSGNVSLTKQWRMTFGSGWDFEKKGISYTTLKINRDLHCWEMAFNWVPLGVNQRWEFVLRVKADVLKDLKYEMRSSPQYF